jgi:hypothetical protein
MADLMGMYAHAAALLAPLIRRGVVTTDPAQADKCCGMPRDGDGFCLHRPGHPIYVDRAGERRG